MYVPISCPSKIFFKTKSSKPNAQNTKQSIVVKTQILSRRMDPKCIKAESILNRDGNLLPFGFYCPQSDGKLSWVCNEDKDGNITSVFRFETDASNHEKKCDYLKDMNEAIYARDELVKAGWKPITPPEVTFKFPGEKEARPLNRAEKRLLKKKLRTAEKNNPFSDGK